LTRVSDIAEQRPEWLWERTARAGWVPLNSLTVVQGITGAGKSTFAAWLAAQVTTGTLPGALRDKPSAVIYGATEDDFATTIRPRLRVAGADLDLVYQFLGDLDQIPEAVREVSAQLVVLDPITSWIKGNKNHGHVVRPVLEGLIALGEDLGTTIVAIAHPRKGNGADQIQEISGSLELANLPRSVLSLVWDGDDDRVLSQVKSSRGPLCPDMAYVLEDGDGSASRFALGGVSERSARSILQDKRTTEAEFRAADDRYGPTSKRIVDLLDDHEGEISTSRLAQVLGIETNKLATYLGRLRDAGRIAKLGYGRWSSLSWARSVGSDTVNTVEAVDTVDGVDSVDINNVNTSTHQRLLQRAEKMGVPF
jgi:hypothetical protein